MRVQDINGHWYEVDDALLAKCEVKLDRESAPAESPSATITFSSQEEIGSRTPAAGSTLAEGSVDSSAC